MTAAQFQLRSGTVADLPLIKQFIRQARLNRLGLDWRRFIVAEDATGRMIGCVQLKPHGPVQELASLVVTRAWRRQGVGRALVEHVQAIAGPPLWLMCASRTAAYYTQFGFVRVVDPDEMPAYFRRVQRLFNLTRPVLGRANELAIMVWR